MGNVICEVNEGERKLQITYKILF